MISLKSQDKPSSSDESDAELVRHIQNNSIEECEREISILYKKYAEDVFRMTKSLYDNSDEGIKRSEDLFQEAWRLALERINRYDSEFGRSFGAWVKGIADNLFLEDYKLSSKKAKAIREIGYSMELGDEGEPIDEEQDLNKLEEETRLGSSQEKKLIRKEDLLSALNILTPVEKEILLEWLRTYDKNDPGNEIHVSNLAILSEKFELQKESLRKVKQRALEKLKKHLGY